MMAPGTYCEIENWKCVEMERVEIYSLCWLSADQKTLIQIGSYSCVEEAWSATSVGMEALLAMSGRHDRASIEAGWWEIHDEEGELVAGASGNYQAEACPDR